MWRIGGSFAFTVDVNLLMYGRSVRQHVWFCCGFRKCAVRSAQPGSLIEVPVQ